MIATECGVEYRPIPGADGYFAGSDGSVWSALRHTGSHWRGDTRTVVGERHRKLKADFRKEDGRARYTIRMNDRRYRRTYGSILVLEAFVGPCPKGLECCHGNGNCTDDRLDNLRWDTRLNNCKDKKLHGTQPCGETHFKAKLSNADVEEIIKLRRDGLSLGKIASQFGVTLQRVYQISKKGAR